MANLYKTPQILVDNLLRPAVAGTMDSTANMFSMEGYYALNQRDQFKNEFRDALQFGSPKVQQAVRSLNIPISGGDTAANDLPEAQDSSSANDRESVVVVMEKVLDENGRAIRTEQPFMEFGISAATAIVERLEPDNDYESQIRSRKDAAANRSIAREQRLEQEEQRLLAIAKGETEEARRQPEGQVKQIEATTAAETTRKLALIKATQMRGRLSSSVRQPRSTLIGRGSKQSPSAFGLTPKLMRRQSFWKPTAPLRKSLMPMSRRKRFGQMQHRRSGSPRRSSAADRLATAPHRETPCPRSRRS